MEPVALRLAPEHDAAACAGIYRPYVTDTVITFEETPPSVDEMGRRMSEALSTHTWLLAEVAGQAVGYAYAHPFASRPAYRWACETSIYLAGEHRGHGVGRLLYDALLEQVTARGYTTALAGITLPNAASVALHTGLGYQPVGTYRRVGWKHGGWHDVAWYQLALRSADQPPDEPR
jgi:L-amino acid N-acyltransferase YncA